MNTNMPAGFKYAGVCAGIKDGADAKKRDIALVVSEVPAVFAGVFTANRVKAAPVLLCKRRARSGGPAQVLIANSGNANACNGKAGFEDALKTAQTTSLLLNVPEEKVLVCSTGTIGVRLPMDRMETGIRAAVAALSPAGFNNAAHAIMTTDTRPKQVTATLKIDNRDVSIYGMAKGSGMINPNMATLLGFIFTDAKVERNALKKCLVQAAAQSFNKITVDGDQSTNDTFLILANGKAGNKTLSPAHPEWKAFRTAVANLAEELAIMIVKDGEGATKFVTVKIKNAATKKDARLAAKAIANSLLVKTAWYGADPNWGRIMAALGYSGAAIDEGKTGVFFDTLEVVRNGIGTEHFADRLSEIISKNEFTITVSLGAGRCGHTVYSCDISHKYVDINAAYMT